MERLYEWFPFLFERPASKGLAYTTAHAKVIRLLLPDLSDLALVAHASACRGGIYATIGRTAG
jgi:hypothetical protein